MRRASDLEIHAGWRTVFVFDLDFCAQNAFDNTKVTHNFFFRGKVKKPVPNLTAPREGSESGQVGAREHRLGGGVLHHQGGLLRVSTRAAVGV